MRHVCDDCGKIKFTRTWTPSVKSDIGENLSLYICDECWEDDPHLSRLYHDKENIRIENELEILDSE